jgi:selenophosphate synthetase-related protein
MAGEAHFAYNQYMKLEQLLEDLRRYPGLTRKAAIGSWTRRSSIMSGDTVLEEGPGDDAGVLPMGDGYLLLAAEGLMPELLCDPPFAGFCSVIANVNDIYAMGGTPLGIVTVVFSQGFSDAAREGFMSGMGLALEHYGIPLLGGHTSPDVGPAIAVCIAGYAKKLLLGDGASPGDRILVAADLEGEAHPPFYAWDTVTFAPAVRTRSRLRALPDMAELEVVSACRDISNSGMLGTLAMMLESAETGARVNLDSIPIPPGIELDWWLKAFPSFGFILAAHPDNIHMISDIMGSRGIQWADIGEVTPGSRLEVEYQGQSALFLDLSTSIITGL